MFLLHIKMFEEHEKVNLLKRKEINEFYLKKNEYFFIDERKEIMFFFQR